MRERLESEDLEEIKDCLNYIKEKFYNTVDYLKHIFLIQDKKKYN